MHVRCLTWGEVDSRQLAEFSFAARRAAGRLSEKASILTLQNKIRELSEIPGSIPILAYSEGAIAGWLCLITHIPLMVFIEAWHPIVAPSANENRIAVQLIVAAKQFTKRERRERLEVYLPVTDDDKPWYNRQRIWYESVGLEQARQESGMAFDFKRQALPATRIPVTFEPFPLAEVSNDDLYRPFSETFADSDDREWLDETEGERRVAFNYWFERSRPFLEKASLVLMRRRQFVGVSVVRPWSEQAIIGPFGVHPDFRRQGLGKALLALSMRRVREAGFETVNLEVDVINHGAYALYQGLGFRQTYLGITHCWKPPHAVSRDRPIQPKSGKR